MDSIERKVGMDISGMFDEADQNSTTGAAQSPAADDQSAAINVDGLIGPADDNSDAQGGDAASVITNQNDGIIPNDTVKTNDLSVVGEVKPPEPEMEPSVEPFIPEVEEPEPEIQIEPITIVPEPIMTPEVEDPEKVDFIKTYTAEYDEALKRATDTVEQLLASVDKSIHEKLPDITIPEQANEFLSKPPADGKVEKFEGVRDIVHDIMEKANESKQQSEAAAAEASRIYDEVQAFKKETKEQIAQLVQDEQQQ